MLLGDSLEELTWVSLDIRKFWDSLYVYIFPLDKNKIVTVETYGNIFHSDKKSKENEEISSARGHVYFWKLRQMDGVIKLLQTSDK